MKFSAPVNASDRSAGASPVVATATRPRLALWANLVATFGGIGRLKPGPGTWGSLVTVILWALISWRIPVEARTWATIVAVAFVTLIGIPAGRTYIPHGNASYQNPDLAWIGSRTTSLK